MYIFNDGKITLDEEIYGFKEGTNIFFIDKLKYFLNSKFKIFSKEDEEIDIDSIEELSESECLVEILKIVKQLKKEWEEK